MVYRIMIEKVKKWSRYSVWGKCEDRIDEINDYYYLFVLNDMNVPCPQSSRIWCRICTQTSRSQSSSPWIIRYVDIDRNIVIYNT